MLSLACLDMAGTTIIDDGLVEAAFTRALSSLGHHVDDQTRSFLIQTMGQSKVEVFTQVLGSRSAGEQGAAAFEEAYAAVIREQGAALVPGTAAALAQLRARGLAICLTTGFAPVTRDLLIDACELGPLIDLALSPVDTPAGRGRPAPDMVLTALMRTGTNAVSDVLVVGDTASDMAAGVAAGAGMVVGVLTGVHGAEQLRATGATHVIASVADVPSLVR